jgi:DNA-binding transcriptional LysR family regulator
VSKVSRVSEVSMDRDDPYRVMDLKALRCFWATARFGSLTQAGIELGISEPAVSQRVRSLEKHLGAKLYEARGGRVALTPTGDRVFGMASDLFERLEEFEEGLSGGEATGTLDVAAYDEAQFYILPEIAVRFRQQFPRVRLRLLSHDAAGAADLVRRNQVDAGVMAQRALPDDLVFHPWRTFQAYLLIPVGHPLLRDGRPAFTDLLRREIVGRFPMVVPQSADQGYQRLADGFRRLGLPFNVAAEVGTMEAVKRFVLHGLGIGVVTGIYLTDDDRTRLAAIELPPELDASTTYGLVLRRDKYLSPPLRGLLALFSAPSS